MRINRRLLPVKAHFFFFMAASGPILPYLVVYGKQLGISEVVMGAITAGVPITFLLAKPVFGFVADYFYDKRKYIFMALIMSMSLFYLGFYFIPPVNVDVEHFKTGKNFSRFSFCNRSTRVFPSLDSNVSSSGILCNVTCSDETSSLGPCQALLGLGQNENFCYLSPDGCNWSEVPVDCHDSCLLQASSQGDRLFRSFEFYVFVILMTLSMIAFNVSNSISDAICFDVLGEGQEKKYGYQRVWGTIGFGITAFLGGLGMDLWSNGDVKNYKPAFLIVLIFTLFDMFCCLQLKLPKIKMSENILKDLSKVLQNKAIFIFVVFVTLVGVLDGFIIYFMFWFVEDLASGTDQMKHIKVLEGLTVAAETLGGEIIFFLLSGKILKTLGYGHTLSLCFFNYALRLCLISFISNPWWIVAVELVMQGPTYALCYTTIVAYANAISPPGTSATMQGIIAGMDDGFGYSIGSLMGGFLYKTIGGSLTFQIFSCLAVLCCLAHIVFHKTILCKSYRDDSKEYRSPAEAFKMTSGVNAALFDDGSH